ncbi:MAG: 4Fe-4S dicluster domain-containing protein [Coriobacteriales bacterium]
MVDKVKIVERIIGAKYFSDDIQLNRSKCPSVRNAKIKCRVCEEICPAQAIKINGRFISIEEDKCIHCGACIAVCPTEAFSSSWITWKDLLEDSLKSIEGTGGHPIITCANTLGKLPQQDDYDRTKVIELPCLDRVDESLLLTLAASGAQDIRLVCANCETCEDGCMGAVWSLVVEYAQDMLASVDSTCQILHLDELPQDAFDIEHVTAANNQVSRRDMLLGSRDRVAHIATDIADEYIEESHFRNYAKALGITKEDSPIITASRGRICEWALGALALKASGSSADAAISKFSGRMMPSRIFSNIRIDGKKCTSCYLCTTYCRTVAIAKILENHKVLGFEATPSRCVQCNACLDVCRENAIELDRLIDVADLLQEKSVKFTYKEWDEIAALEKAKTAEKTPPDEQDML